MSDAIGLGRVVVVDGGEGGRRVLRAIRELVRLGRAEAAVAVHGPLERHAAFLREADEAIEGHDRREALAAAVKAAGFELAVLDLEPVRSGRMNALAGISLPVVSS
jgi:uncharacterized protein